MHTPEQDNAVTRAVFLNMQKRHKYLNEIPEIDNVIRYRSVVPSFTTKEAKILLEN
jgi:division protein CdvB (Snf7/Vps24/ESCRT-III family)